MHKLSIEYILYNEIAYPIHFSELMFNMYFMPLEFLEKYFYRTDCMRHVKNLS